MISWAIRFSQVKGFLLNIICKPEYFDLIAAILDHIIFFFGKFCGKVSVNNSYIEKVLASFKEGATYGMVNFNYQMP